MRWTLVDMIFLLIYKSMNQSHTPSYIAGGPFLCTEEACGCCERHGLRSSCIVRRDLREERSERACLKIMEFQQFPYPAGAAGSQMRCGVAIGNLDVYHPDSEGLQCNGEV